jgi:NitT/TauT family transport system permease protein
VNRLWIRAAQAMGAGGRVLFSRVVLPGALPFVIAGLRQGFARAWIAVVGGEMIAATRWGLGWVIFDAREFLNADVMIGSLVVIGVLGLAFERLLFQALERRTVGRWGMLRASRS